MKRIQIGAFLIGCLMMSFLIVRPAYADLTAVIDQTLIDTINDQTNGFLKNQLDAIQKQVDGFLGNSKIAGNTLPNQKWDYLPTDWQSVSNLLVNGGQYSGLSNSAKSIETSQAILNNQNFTHYTNLDPTVRTLFQKERDTSAIQQALGQEAYNDASQRSQVLDGLIQAIDQTQDPKTILELQARIQVEQAKIQNDQLKLASLNQLQSAQQIAYNQQADEINAISAGNGNFPKLKPAFHR